jgi:chemotaxis response regulator CheB
MSDIAGGSSATGQSVDAPASSLVVGLGASAGGVKALQEFFRHVPADLGAAYVVVLHLSPEHESRLAEVLQSAASIPVSRVNETVRVQRDHVYVISPNTSLRMADRLLTVSDTLRSEERRAPVDIFFRTLADTHGPRAVCIVLSGTGANGSNGLKRIKERCRRACWRSRGNWGRRPATNPSSVHPSRPTGAVSCSRRSTTPRTSTRRAPS